MSLKNNRPNLFSTSRLAVLFAFNAFVLSPAPTWAHVDVPTTNKPTDDVQVEAQQLEPPSTVHTPSPEEQLKTLDKLNEHLQQLRVRFQKANERFDQLVEQIGSRDTSEAELRTKLALNDLRILRDERDQIHRELRQTELRLQLEKEALESGKSPPGDDVYKHFLQEQVTFLEQQYEQARKIVRASSPSLLRMKTQIEIAKSALENKSPKAIVSKIQNKCDLLRDEFKKADGEYEKQQLKVRRMGQITVDLMLLQDDRGVLDRSVGEAEREVDLAIEALARTLSLTEKETNAVGILSKQGYLADMQLAQKLETEGRLTREESSVLEKILEVLKQK